MATDTAESRSEPAGTEIESTQAAELEVPSSEVESAAGATANAPDGALIAAGEAVDISYEVNSIQLVYFLRLTDLITCDFDEDGWLDVLVLSSRVSTGYGYEGFGNGTFSEGPSFDLPFRPAAAVSLGRGNSGVEGAFLVSASGIVSAFFPLTSEDSSLRGQADSFSVFRVEKPDGMKFAVHEAAGESVQLYQVSDTAVADLGQRVASECSGPAEWYAALATWIEEDNGQLQFPLPPAGTEKTTQLADLNSDGIIDLVYWEAGKLILSLSQSGEALAKTLDLPCTGKPAVIRIADVDSNGLPDLLVLEDATGVLDVYLCTATVES
ncbi:FG-GAP repeat domain-containing protein [Candidatus Bipolaricaulota bacterium]